MYSYLINHSNFLHVFNQAKRFNILSFEEVQYAVKKLLNHKQFEGAVTIPPHDLAENKQFRK